VWGYALKLAGAGLANIIRFWGGEVCIETDKQSRNWDPEREGKWVGAEGKKPGPHGLINRIKGADFA